MTKNRFTPKKILQMILTVLVFLSLGITIKSDYASFPSYFYVVLIIVSVVSALGLIVILIIDVIKGEDQNPSNLNP